MSFQEAVTTVLTKKYADFSGRARRSELWWFVLAEIILFAVLGTLGRASDIFMIVYYVAALALIIPGLAVAVRRLHDTGRSGWWILISFIPLVGAIILIVFYVTDSGPDNQYGPNPKALASPYGV